MMCIMLDYLDGVWVDVVVDDVDDDEVFSQCHIASGSHSHIFDKWRMAQVCIGKTFSQFGL
jgi:hypothetical protein